MTHSIYRLDAIYVHYYRRFMLLESVIDVNGKISLWHQFSVKLDDSCKFFTQILLNDGDSSKSNTKIGVF